MRVALVHDWLTGMRGGEKCLEVFCELFPDADLYTLIYLPEKVSPTLRRMKVHASWINRMPWAERAYRYYLPLFPRAIEAFDLRNYDLVLSSSHCVAKGARAGGALHVAYIYAPMRYVWDLHDAYFGADSSVVARAGMAVFRGYLQRWDVRSAQAPDHCVAISQNIAAKIHKLYGRHAAVIYPPVDMERFFIQERQEAYYLVVSALVPYKRVDLAVEAFNALGLPLKIAGDGPLRKRLERMARPNIEFLGWVDDAPLARLYASCQALIFPGEEDFGIVPLEAQASGRPVIAYGRGGALETVVALDGARSAAAPASGMFFSAPDAAGLSAAVRAFQESKQRFDPAAIRGHAALFSRERFKSEMRNFIHDCFARRESA